MTRSIQTKEKNVDEDATKSEDIGRKTFVLIKKEKVRCIQCMNSSAYITALHSVKLLKETFSLIARTFTILYNALQQRYDERCSLENQSSLLLSPLAENIGGAGANGMYSAVLSCTDTKAQS